MFSRSADTGSRELPFFTGNLLQIQKSTKGKGYDRGKVEMLI